MYKLIGLSGKAGSGKDFIGREVLRLEGYQQWAFAWPMKMLAIGQGASYDDVFTTKPPAVRAMLQRIGTEEGWMVYGKDYWLRQAEAWMATLHENHGVSRFYFSDVRYPHECDWIHALGGKLVRIMTNRAYPLAGTPAAEHSSETALDSRTHWDSVIHNDLGASAWEIAHALAADGIITRVRKG